MTFLLDHVFIACGPGAPELDALLAAGFCEGPPNTHPGQGTANRRVFFENAYLELLYLTDPAEAGAPAIRPSGLLERCERRAGSCPFGFALRLDEPERFDGWDYRPPYLPPGSAIRMAHDSADSTRPLVFLLPGPRSATLATPHPSGARQLRSAELRGPALDSPQLRATELTLRQSATWHLHLALSGQTQTVDLRPSLPLSLGPG